MVTITLFLRRNERLEDMARIIPGLEDKVALSRAHDDQRACHCEEVVVADDVCCNQCCREEFDRVERHRPWRGFCGINGCSCDLNSCARGGHEDTYDVAGNDCATGGGAYSGGGGTCGITVDTCTGAVGACVGGGGASVGSDRSVRGEDQSCGSKNVGRLKRKMSVLA